MFKKALLLTFTMPTAPTSAWPRVIQPFWLKTELSLSVRIPVVLLRPLPFVHPQPISAFPLLLRIAFPLSVYELVLLAALTTGPLY